jgi:hypothetical protein
MEFESGLAVGRDSPMNIDNAESGFISYLKNTDRDSNDSGTIHLFFHGFII